MDEASSSERRCNKECREKFLAEILKSESEKSTHFNVLTREKYMELIKEVEEAQKTEKKTSLQQRRLKRFNILEIGGLKKLVARNDGNENIKYYLSADEVYDVIYTAHVAVGHGGRDRMSAETSKKFANITKEMICLFLSMCQVCQQKKTKRKNCCTSNKPVLHTDMITRCQVELIDFQTQADGKFNFILVYQDCTTKFVLLRPLESKKAEEVAYHLNDIFLTIGAPCIVQSDIGKEFVNEIICELNRLWPELKIIPGKACQSQGPLERAKNIKTMLSSWLSDNHTTRWSEGLRHVQFMKNRAFHPSIKQSPYKAMFSTEPRVGLSSTLLPPELIKEIQNEEDLNKLCGDENENDTESSNNVSQSDEKSFFIAKDVQKARTINTENLEKQAKKMKTSSNDSHSSNDVAENPTSIPDLSLWNQIWRSTDIVLQNGA
ncbi:KRAB-A domain-containing protein 2-like isoform X2 [Venturia canescens]|uniref:KRAB-A domain-containing protein 2-like isoform X2 n=1 Tax=Venturia canescens TaxID=32260 RepID=UPI001C9BDE0C|nr:KRAB-A domain-containing protein 2-like isoform X2 [Venturia canescens]